MFAFIIFCFILTCQKNNEACINHIKILNFGHLFKSVDVRNTRNKVYLFPLTFFLVYVCIHMWFTVHSLKQM